MLLCTIQSKTNERIIPCIVFFFCANNDLLKYVYVNCPSFVPKRKVFLLTATEVQMHLSANAKPQLISEMKNKLD